MKMGEFLYHGCHHCGCPIAEQPRTGEPAQHNQELGKHSCESMSLVISASEVLNRHEISSGR